LNENYVYGAIGKRKVQSWFWYKYHIFNM